MKVGDTLWCHDHRDHRRPWFEKTITSETRMSWIVGDHGGFKVNKKTMLENMGAWGTRKWHTKESMDNEIWVSRNRYKIADSVQSCRDPEVLRQVAALVGHEINDAVSSPGDRNA